MAVEVLSDHSEDLQKYIEQTEIHRRDRLEIVTFYKRPKTIMTTEPRRNETAAAEPQRVKESYEP